MCIAGLFGGGFDAYDYYAHHNIRGNYYGWFLIGPFYVCLFIIMSLTIRNMPSNTYEASACQ